MIWFDLCRAAATALSKRHADGSLPVEDYNIELEDQGGQQVKFGTETDQRLLLLLLVGSGCDNS